MNTARTSDTFERAIARYPIIVLGSTYTSNLRRYFDLFAREQVKVVFFEEFISSQQQVFDDITDFLGVSALQVEKSKSWYNRTNYTVSGPAQRQLNRIGRHIVASRYRRHMNDGDKFTLSDRVRSKLHYWFFRYVNPALLRRPKPPPMDLHTRAFLTEHLAQRNKGLSELLGRDVSAVWTDLKM